MMYASGVTCSITIGLPSAPLQASRAQQLQLPVADLEWYRARRPDARDGRRPARPRRRGANGVKLSIRAAAGGSNDVRYQEILAKTDVLRGVGATVSLPLLDAMIQRSPPASESTPRWLHLFANGVIQGSVESRRLLDPTFAVSDIAQPLEPVQKYINVLSGLSHLQADTLETAPATIRFLRPFG